MKFHFFHIVNITVLLLAIQQVSAEEPVKKTTYFQKVIKTAKERLGEKASDNQRINNCKVPIEKRGSKPRPDKCRRVKR
jgi:hypothetical protein